MNSLEENKIIQNGTLIRIIWHDELSSMESLNKFNDATPGYFLHSIHPNIYCCEGIYDLSTIKNWGNRDFVAISNQKHVMFGARPFLVVDTFFRQTSSNDYFNKTFRWYRIIHKDTLLWVYEAYIRVL